MPQPNDPHAAEHLRRLAALRERRAQVAQQRTQQFAGKRLPGHGHRTAHRAR
jgi:hypothetical protein